MSILAKLMIIAMTTVKLALSNTPPAAISFAFFASIMIFLLHYKSTKFSTTVFKEFPMKKHNENTQ